MALRTPEFLQTKTYSAMRDRLALQHGGGIQSGTWDTGDFLVTQRAAGANMSVDVAAGYALVAANDPGNAGLYHAQNDATFNASLQTNGSAWAVGNATNPRIDIVVLLVTDTTDGGDTSDNATVAVVQGTATAGATLSNRTGAAAVPTGALLLADVLMPAGSTTVTTANIRDRRPSARLGWFKVATTTPAGSPAIMTFSNLTLWGGVDHVRLVGRTRSLRPSFAQTGLRFSINGISSGYGFAAAVDNSNPAAATTGATSAYIGQVAAASSADMGAFTVDLMYVNRPDGLPRYYEAALMSYVSSGSLMSNERVGGFMPTSAGGLTSVSVMDDAGSNMDPNSHLDLWVFGG